MWQLEGSSYGCLLFVVGLKGEKEEELYMELKYLENKLAESRGLSAVMVSQRKVEGSVFCLLRFLVYFQKEEGL